MDNSTSTENKFLPEKKLGISGKIAQAFLTSEITPLLALVGFLLGLFAIVITPREEEPQINVTFANVFIPFPGASPQQVESLVTTPAEQIVSEIEGVEHIYSTSSPGMATLTVRFLVGEPRTDAIVRLYNAFYANSDWLPANLGVGKPLIKPKGIDDVPIVSLTLWSEKTDMQNRDLLAVARSLQTELQRVEGTRDIDIIGGPDQVVQVLFDPQRIAAYSLVLDDVRRALMSANQSTSAGNMPSVNGDIQIQAGDFLIKPEEVADLVVGVYQGSPVFLRDVAQVKLDSDRATQYVTQGFGSAGVDAKQSRPSFARFPAITLSIAKKPGENAVDVANHLLQRLEQLKGVTIPDAIKITVTRNYGETAEDKAQTLIKKLLFATLSVILLVLFALGKREAFVVGAAVIVTLAITLFASWAWGFTLNRVSLFALIFSIGILVDDAIVVVENIHRHMSQGKLPLQQAIPLAVDEVGGPTILATFTVIAALLPMAFVSGLMGPYMLPIPINASIGMLISLLVAFVFTPWLFNRLFKNHHSISPPPGKGEAGRGSNLNFLFTKLMSPFLNKRAGRKARLWLLGGIFSLIFISISLVVMKAVVLKMLPFDNKSEFQLVIDMPEGTALEDTQKVLQSLAQELEEVPEVTHYQVYAGTAAPINFNGLVRQQYLRRAAHMGEIQVNLVDKNLRNRKSHEIALAVREQLQPIAKKMGANMKLAEVPPGPPVLSPLVAEVYGLNYEGQIAVAKQVRQVFESTEDVVDIDDSIEAEQARWILVVDRARASRLGIDQGSVTAAIQTALSGEDIAYLHGQTSKVPVPIRLELSAAEKANLQSLMSIKLRNASGNLIALSEITQWVEAHRQQTIHHKDLLPVVYVTADVAGETDSPLYGLADIYQTLQSTSLADSSIIEQRLNSQPELPLQWSLKWDGELQVTLDTFRDMGIAYSVGLVLIYLLVVAMFKSYSVPLIIMAPIPLTIIGILPGHALLGQQFTAPSMIGMIALAGIIVRNSILLVDFIQQQLREGVSLETATINAAAVRALPIGLTALAAMLGGFFILDDPIFGGLAVSLIFGLLVSTLLTLIVIPVVYYAYHYQQQNQPTVD